MTREQYEAIERAAEALEASIEDARDDRDRSAGPYSKLGQVAWRVSDALNLLHTIPKPDVPVIDREAERRERYAVAERIAVRWSKDPSDPVEDLREEVAEINRRYRAGEA